MASDTNIHDRIEKLRDALTDGLYEKEKAVRLSLLAAVAGESVFFLGAPGCAKSMIARRIMQAFKADGDKVTGGGYSLLRDAAQSVFHARGRVRQHIAQSAQRRA